MENILAKMKKYPQVLSYLPGDKDLGRLPRNFCVNLLYSIVGEEITRWVSGIVEERNAKVAKDRKMLLELDSEVA